MSHGEVAYIDGHRVASPEYRSWQMLKERAKNAMVHGYRHQMDMDPRWRDFDVFLADMGRRPFISATMDRRDNDKGYWPDNCRWASRATQSRNRGAYNVLNQSKADKIRFLYRTGLRQVDIAYAYGITQAQVSQIVRGERWVAIEEQAK